MRRLCYSYIVRLGKNGFFKLPVLLSSGLGIFCTTLCAKLDYYLTGLTNGLIGGYVQDVPIIDHYIFKWILFLAAYFAFFISYFEGTEYADGTIRNKILAGYSRKQIYLAGMLADMLAGWIMFSVYWIAGLFAGFTALGIFREMSIREFVFYVLCLYAIMAALAALFRMISMIVPNRTASMIICIGLILVLLLIPFYQTGNLQWHEYFTLEFDNGDIVYHVGDKCPFYIGGIRREISEFMLDFLPGGPLIQFMCFPWLDEIDLIYLKIPVIFLGAAVFTLFSTMAGLRVFWTEELK